MTTNKRTIGPFGQDAEDTFNANNDGAPLLFSKIKFGLISVYEMSFTFYGKAVLLFILLYMF